jgi:DNA-binding Lrp family transcriptional regulator
MVPTREADGASGEAWLRLCSIAEVKIEPRAAMPAAMPIWRNVVLTPDAIPAFCGGTTPIAVEASGGLTRPAPSPATMNPASSTPPTARQATTPVSDQLFSPVRRRIGELRHAGLLYFEIDVDNRVLGLNVEATLWLSVEPARLDEVGRALAAHQEIPFAAATTGPTNLLASALFRDTQHLYEYLTGPLAGLPGVRSVQTAPIIRTLKRTGSVH